MSIKQSILIRVQFAFLGIMLIAFIISLKIIYIQFIKGADYQKKAEEIGLQYRIRKATRGNIYADNGVLLATSIPLYKLCIDPASASETLYGSKIDSLSGLLANFFQDRTKRDYLLKINDARKAKKRYLVLNNRLLTFAEKEKITLWPIFREGKKGGVIFEKVDERTYPFKELAARTVGYINENSEGVGLEMSFQKQLGGLNGKALYQKMQGGEWMPINSGAQIRPVDGVDVYTTVDVNIQDIAHNALYETMQKTEAAYGCVIVMEVKTGEVKAMANLGRIKNSEGQYEYHESYNYAIGDQGSTDPGSTFKAASMLALVEDTTLSLQDTIETGGGTYRYFDRTMTDTRTGGWGKLTVLQAFAYSSNIGISKLITRHFGRNPDEYIAYLKKFGLATPLESSFKMTGMAKPFIKDTKSPYWSGVTLPWMSVGYETQGISPLQILTFFNAVANNGYLVQPKIVRKIKKADLTLEEYPSVISKEPICKPQSLALLKKMLEAVVEFGTAKNIKSSQYKIAGKTGTSQKLNNRGRYIKKYHTSFAGYFPADNPKYSCIVVIDEPKGAEQYGADVSAPVFKAISDRLFAQDVDVQSQPLVKRQTPIFQTNLPANQVSYAEDIKEICANLHIPTVDVKNEELVLPEAGKMAVHLKERKIKPSTIPDVKGLSLRDAIYILENQGLKVFFSGSGRVKTQSLMPGSPLRRGEKIVIQLQ